MDNNTDQKPNEESLQPAEVEGVEVAQAPAADEETSQANSDQDSSKSEEQAGDSVESDEKDEASTAAEAAPAPIQPVVHKSGAPVFAIIAAVLVAIGLAAITVYAYMETQKDNKPATTQTNTQEDDAAADSQAVDDTSKEIDKALEASDEADFPEDELTDQNLNL